MKKLYFTLLFLLAGFFSLKSQTNTMADSDSIITRYLGGSGMNFKDSEELRRFILTHGVDKDVFKTFVEMQSAIELEIRNDSIVNAYDVALYEPTRSIPRPYTLRKLIASNIKLPVKEWPNHKVFFLKKDTTGTHILRGKKPDNFILPHHDSLKTPFTFIGTIDGNSPEFQWLSMEKLHIAFPLYNCDDGVFLDYSTPEKPLIVEPTNFTDFFKGEDHSAFKDIVFKETRFKSTDKLEAETEKKGDYIQCGIPWWYQYPEIPVCPRTGEVMRFVCTIPSDSDIKIIAPLTKTSFDVDYLTFADYGHLFVFYNPKSKVLFAKWQF